MVWRDQIFLISGDSWLISNHKHVLHRYCVGTFEQRRLPPKSGVPQGVARIKLCSLLWNLYSWYWIKQQGKNLPVFVLFCTFERHTILSSWMLILNYYQYLLNRELVLCREECYVCRNIASRLKRRKASVDLFIIVSDSRFRSAASSAYPSITDGVFKPGGAGISFCFVSFQSPPNNRLFRSLTAPANAP